MNIKQKVDKAKELKDKIEALEAEYNSLVSEIKTHAKRNNIHVVEGMNWNYVLSDVDFIKIEPVTLKELTTSEEEFMSVIKVDLTKAKSKFGATLLENFGVVETKKFYRGKFKRAA